MDKYIKMVQCKRHCTIFLFFMTVYNLYDIIVGVKCYTGGANLDKPFSNENEINSYPEESGSEDVLITDEVIAVIAGIACSEVEGVASMSSGLAGGLVEAFGGENLAKGVKVETKDDETTIDLYIIVKYGYRIPDLAWKIQEKVKDTVESLTSISVPVVNIHVQGVDFGELSV